MDINSEQKQILEHTARTGLPFCGRSNNMNILCQHGFMNFVGYKSFTPDPYYEITSKGLNILTMS